MGQKAIHAGEQHPEEWRQDLNPEANAGQNLPGAGLDEASMPTAANFGELKRMLHDFDKDELERILIVPAGARLEQGATYVDLATPDREEFTARGDIEAGPNNWFVPKKGVEYQLWNKLIGVDNPERIGEADDS